MSKPKIPAPAPPRLPTGTTIFCDDIREEVGGKLTYVGVYGTSMNIDAATLPIIIPLFGFAARITVPLNYRYREFVFKLEFHNENDESHVLFETPPTVRVEPDGPTAKDAHAIGIGIHGTISGLKLTESGKVVARGYFDGNARRMGSLAIVVNIIDADDRRLSAGYSGW